MSQKESPGADVYLPLGVRESSMAGETPVRHRGCWPNVEFPGARALSRDRARPAPIYGNRCLGIPTPPSTLRTLKCSHVSMLGDLD